MHKRTTQVSRATAFRSYQFRINHALLYGTSNYNNMGITSYGDSTCKWCNAPKQNWTHLVLYCPRSLIFWHEIENEFNFLLVNESLTPQLKLIGSQNPKKVFKNSLNAVILIATKMIFDSLLSLIVP
jgi:hypothetical protein